MREDKLGGLEVRITGGTDRNGGGDGPVVVLMHGFGVPGNDLVLLPRNMRVPAGTRFVFPEGPILLGGEYGAGRAWWRIDMERVQRAMERGEPRDQSRDEPPGMAASSALVNAMLDDVERTMAPSHLVLGGFSQGAMLTCDVALRSLRKLDALIVMSGTPLAAEAWDPGMERRRGLPVLMSHGDADPLLAMVQAERLRDRLTGAGLAVRWVPFRGGHGVPPEVLDAVGTFLEEVTGPAIAG